MRKALVFGPSETASPLSRALEREGWTAVAAGEGPEPAAIDGPAQLRETLAKFARDGGELVHPGTGEWSERPELATIAQEMGLAVLGPPARVLSLFSNKLNLLTEADRLGLPHLLITLDPLYTVREIEALIRERGVRYPFVLKAVRGIPGGGYLVIHEASELHLKLPLWLERLKRLRGNAMLIAERYVDTARLLIQPFARDPQGELTFFPIVDASLLSRYRKVIEFCPAPRLDPEIVGALHAHTRKLAESCGFLGVGTLEFLSDAQRNYVVNGTARLNSTFRLWETVAGTSALSWQLATLLGPLGRSLAPPVRPNPQWAMGLAYRIFAEDPVLELPQPGHVAEVSVPPGDGITLRVQPGTDVDPDGVGLLGLGWVGAESFDALLTRARQSLSEVWLAGSIQTNERFLDEVLAHPWVREGIFHAGFLDEEFVPSLRPPAPLTSLIAALCKLATEPDRPGDRWAVGDQWVKPSEDTLSWREGPRLTSSASARLSGVLDWNSGPLRVLVYPTAGSPTDRWLVRAGAWMLVVRRVRKRTGARGATTGDRLRALVGGRVHSILFQAGARIPAHEPVLILESLGEFVTQALPTEIRILRWLRTAGDRVEAGDPLAEFEIASGN